jgi:HK97 family phage portal protein
MTQTWNAGGGESVMASFYDYVANGYADNSIVFAIVSKRAALFSEAEFKWQRLADKSIYGTPSLALLEKPWPGATTGELLTRIEQHGSLAGNSYTVRVGPNELAQLRPDYVTIVSEEFPDSKARPSRRVVGYVYQEPGGDPQVYDVSEVAHYCPIPDPLARFRGMSWLTPVVREINSDKAMTDHKQKFFDNAATPNMVLRYKSKINKDDLAALSDRFAAKFGSPDNAGKTLLLDDGADLTVVGNSFEQMNFTAIQAAGENRIAAAAGVPGIVVGLKEGLAAATYSNYEQAMRNFADTTARPWWRGVCSSLSKLVAVPDGSRLWYDTAAIAALRQGEKERAETTQIQAAAALNLINAGYDPATVASALTANDLTLLTHTGLVPTLLAPPGANPNAPTGSGA